MTQQVQRKKRQKCFYLFESFTTALEVIGILQYFATSKPRVGVSSANKNTKRRKGSLRSFYVCEAV